MRCVEALGFGERQVGGEGGEVAVVGGGAAVGLEEGAAGAQGVEVALPVGDVVLADFAELFEVVLEAGVFGVDDCVGAEGGEDAALPAGGFDGLVVFERIEGGVGGGEDFDLEAVEEGAREELGRVELGGDDVVVLVGVFGREAFGQAEELGEGVVEPEARGGAAEEVVVLGEDAPDFARVGVTPCHRSAGCLTTRARRPASRACGRCSGRAG